MKKAKIMLMAIATLAVVGGVLAFKTSTTQKALLCYTLQDPGAGGFCAFATSITITDNNPQFNNVFYSTEQVVGNDPDAFCTTIRCDQLDPKDFKFSE